MLNDLSENFNQEIGNKSGDGKLKEVPVINEEYNNWNNTFERINGLDEAENQISDLEDKIAEDTQLEQKKKIKKKWG